MTVAASATLNLGQLLRAGDLIVPGQGTAEPLTLVKMLAEQISALPKVEVFAGISYSAAFSNELAAATNLSSFGAMGSLTKLAASGHVAVIPCNYVDLAEQLVRRAGEDGLVLILQVAPADAEGNHSLGIAVDYTYDMIDSARVILAEINDQVPVVAGAPAIHSSRITASITSSIPLHVLETPVPSDLHKDIAAHASALVPEAATLQLGIGTVPAAVGTLLSERRDLAVHSGLAGDWVLDFARAGALRTGPGSVAVGGAAGSNELYKYLSTSSEVSIRPVSELSRPNTLAAIPRFVAMNSALQVDLAGQVNAEWAGRRYMGGIGGQVDFFRGAQLSEGGLAILMMPATATKGTRSRIVQQLDNGTVTTPRSGVDFIVTEHGAADLRGRTVRERAETIAAIAAPDFRDELREAAEKTG